MKKFCGYVIELLCVIIFLLTIFNILNIKIDINKFTATASNENGNKILDSSVFSSSLGNVIDIETINKTSRYISEFIEVDGGYVEKVAEVSEEEKKDKHYSLPPVLNFIDTSNYQAISSEIITMSHYGHDCSGAACSLGLTASGYFIGDGRVYYNDPTFGSVRIIAADKKYPLGTIVRIGYNDGAITAIVLDRGGEIGDHGKFQVDLLTPSEAVSSKLGVVHDTKLEVLRLGY